MLLCSIFVDACSLELPYIIIADFTLLNAQVLTIDDIDTKCTGDFEFSYTNSIDSVRSQNLINLLLAFRHHDKQSLRHQRILPHS